MSHEWKLGSPTKRNIGWRDISRNHRSCSPARGNRIAGVKCCGIGLERRRSHGSKMKRGTGMRINFLRMAGWVAVSLALSGPGYVGGQMERSDGELHRLDRDDDGYLSRDFERKIRPVLVSRCYECHSAESDAIQGGLALDTREGIRRGGDSGPAVVPGESSSSLLVKAIRQHGDRPTAPDVGSHSVPLSAEQSLCSQPCFFRRGASDARGAGSRATSEPCLPALVRSPGERNGATGCACLCRTISKANPRSIPAKTEHGSRNGCLGGVLSVIVGRRRVPD